MLNEVFKQYKSGTDIRGVAVEGVEGQHVNLTDDVIRKMAEKSLAEGVTDMTLEVRVSNDPAIELYKSLGKADIRDGRHRTVPYAKRFGQFLS